MDVMVYNASKKTIPALITICLKNNPGNLVPEKKNPEKITPRKNNHRKNNPKCDFVRF